MKSALNEILFGPLETFDECYSGHLKAIKRINNLLSIHTAQKVVIFWKVGHGSK